jgi:hypothetical protein
VSPCAFLAVQRIFRLRSYEGSRSGAERERASPTAMLELVVILALLAGACWLAARAFERPEGVYVKSAVGAALAIGGGLGLIVLLSPWLGSGAGLGVMLIYLAFVALVLALAALACIAAGARRAWDAMRSRDRGC